MCFHGEGKNSPAFGYSVMVVRVDHDHDNDGGKKYHGAKPQKKH